MLYTNVSVFKQGTNHQSGVGDVFIQPKFGAQLLKSEHCCFASLELGQDPTHSARGFAGSLWLQGQGVEYGWPVVTRETQGPR